MQTLNHAMTYLVSIMESVLTPPHQDAFVKRDLLENDAKKVIEEDTWGVELKFFLFRLIDDYEIRITLISLPP